MNPPTESVTAFIKAEALAIGFSECGFAKAAFLEEEHSHLVKWLNNKKQGSISYLEKNTEQKTDPKKISPRINSVIGLIINYFGQGEQHPDAFYKTTRYAWGKDYHLVLNEKLCSLKKTFSQKFPEEEFLFFADSNRLLEKAWAIECGLGWRGKNSLLINEKFGSFVFIGIMLTSLQLTADTKMSNRCASCRKCLDACPANALEVPFELNASRCITNFTIEQKEGSSEKNDTHSWIYGCDICQMACPWNIHLPFTDEPDFLPNKELLMMRKDDWENLDENKFIQLFKDSAIRRIGYHKIMHNIKKASP